MTSVIDVNTGKIVGAKKGSLTWWHEKGHLAYANNPKFIKLEYWQEQFFHFSLIFTMSALFFNVFKWLAFPCYLIYIFIDLYEESWCWDYAKKKYGKRK